MWLLAVSYYFYMQWNPIYIILLFSCTLFTYICARIIEYLKVNEESAYRKKKKLCFVACIVLCIGVLGFFKYFDFAIALLNHLLFRIHINEITWNYNIILPVGISFYTLQALDYVIDVYRGDIYAETKKGKLQKWCNLFIVFIVSGLWHGASVVFIFWGLLNGLYQVVEDVITEAKKYFTKYHIRWRRFTGETEEDSKVQFSANLFHTIVTFVLITFSWLFFRAGGLEDAWKYSDIRLV